MTNAAPSQDRRAFGRKATYQHAVAIIPKRAPMRCIVRDLSEGGASLDFGGPVTLPARIQLRWDGGGQIANCEVRHSEGDGVVGVQFTCEVGREIARDVRGQRATPQFSGPEIEPVIEPAAAEPENCYLTPPPLPVPTGGAGAGLVQARRAQRAGRIVDDARPPASEPKRVSTPEKPAKMFSWLNR